jgi:hypothetical protein
VRHALLFSSAFLLNACLFDQEPGLLRPRSHYDFASLDSLDNPLARWYPVARDRNLVGVKFAFRTMDYEKEVDSNITVFALAAGGLPAITGAYFDLKAKPGDILRFLGAVAAKGGIPFVTLDPKDWGNTDIAYQRTFVSLINQGKFDSSLSAQAAALRDFGRPVLLRFAHEMNGDWYPYSGAFAGGSGDADRDGKADGPENYVKAWRRVHDLFAAAGALNLVWIFCPNAETFPPEEWNLPFEYYPGSDYVDMISVDSYESPDKQRRDLEAVMDGFYNELGLFLEAHGSESGFAPKPFGLSEFGTSRRTASEKGDWYAGALRYIAGDGRIKMSILYNASNGSQDFSIGGLGDRLRASYADARFQFGAMPPLPLAKR